ERRRDRHDRRCGRACAHVHHDHRGRSGRSGRARARVHPDRLRRPVNPLRTITRDLFERRLWPVAAGLVALLIAIPVVFLRPAPAALQTAAPAPAPATPAPATPAAAPATGPPGAPDLAAGPSVALTSAPVPA